jgi:hypothetical protein
MSKTHTHKIISCKLVKVEKLYNQSQRQRYYYSLELQGIDEPLIIENEVPITPGLVGHKIKYKLNSENEVSDFEFL